MDKLRVVPQLRVNHLHILRVAFQEQVFHVVEATLDVGAKLPHGHALIRTYLATDLVGDNQYRDVEIVATLANTVRNLVYLANLAQKLVPQTVILLISRGVENTTSQFLLAFIAAHLLHDANCLCHMPACICFDRHELGDVGALVDRPVLVELLEQALNFGSMAEQVFRSQLAEFQRHGGLGCHHREVQLRDGVLEFGESLVHHVALLEDHLGELVFLSVDPEIREGLLCRVQDLDQVIQRGCYRIIVENPISCRKVLAVVAGCALEEREREEILKAL